MKMEDYTKAFPGRVNLDQYKPLIEAAQKAGKGDDGFYRVIIEEYLNSKEAIRAANAIRNHCRAHNIELRVSCPEKGKSVYVFKSSTPAKARTRKKKNPESAAPKEPVAGEAPPSAPVA